MNDHGDDELEMIHRPHLDDRTIEQLLSRRHSDEQHLLTAFIEDLDVACSVAAPQPTPALATLMADISTENGDLSATAASNVPGPAPQAAGLPKWRKRNMIEIALAKLSALGLAAKLGVAGGALAVSGTAAAATGVLPQPVVDVIERTGIELPGDDSADDAVDPGDAGDVVVVDDLGDAEVEAPGSTLPTLPTQAEFGVDVATSARDGAPQEDGRGFGEDTSTKAREANRPGAVPTPDDNPGTQYREDAGSQRPDGVPTADDNPGTQYREDAGSQRPDGVPTADDNPGSSFRDAAGSPLPAGPPVGGFGR